MRKHPLLFFAWESNAVNKSPDINTRHVTDVMHTHLLLNFEMIFPVYIASKCECTLWHVVYIDFPAAVDCTLWLTSLPPENHFENIVASPSSSFYLFHSFMKKICKKVRIYFMFSIFQMQQKDFVGHISVHIFHAVWVGRSCDQYSDETRGVGWLSERECDIKRSRSTDRATDSTGDHDGVMRCFW